MRLRRIKQWTNTVKSVEPKWSLPSNQTLQTLLNIGLNAHSVIPISLLFSYRDSLLQLGRKRRIRPLNKSRETAITLRFRYPHPLNHRSVGSRATRSHFSPAVGARNGHRNHRDLRGAHTINMRQTLSSKQVILVSQRYYCRLSCGSACT